ncbi:Crp/Fnr family transcriptional regulator [Asticcacaulis sp. ZE23SCel15]|uniref:Crp/Fnr family transcriptional regulator n=1 Tax=Asticcacaulis sp. ZE23SCel15 TaxID=3059027 RepID=UPI00265F9C15|nr:Crp/Fnr family transcriptional regulator [Asticcacaulis sp. ZE23SCel15]WKL57664.1 Crp/Fnr family transcriptional regulator [Asticcacaulis sp. ZE23SCel15]
MIRRLSVGNGYGASGTGPDIGDSNLLKALKAADRALLEPHLERLSVDAGTVLVEAGDNVKYAYFPCGPTLVSFMVLLDDARGVETALVGREGAVGGIVSQGRLPAYARAMVQFSGPMLRIDAVQLEKAKAQSATLRHFFARYADCLLAQVFQGVACNATHSIEQRTAKWLCAAIDRTGDHEVPLTQEQLAGMLGVGRSYVGRVIGAMKRRGTLETLRGRLRIKGLEELEGLSCGCNNLVRAHFEDVLKGVYPSEGEA